MNDRIDDLEKSVMKLLVKLIDMKTCIKIADAHEHVHDWKRDEKGMYCANCNIRGIRHVK